MITIPITRVAPRSCSGATATRCPPRSGVTAPSPRASATGDRPARIAPGRTVGDGVLALPIGKPRRFETPLYLPAHRALAFGDARDRIDGGLRIWQQGATGRSWQRPGVRPTLLPLLDLDVERVLVTHGPAVLHDATRRLWPPWLPGHGLPRLKD